MLRLYLNPLQGRLVYKNTHVRELWSLVTLTSGDVYKLPGQPTGSSGEALPAGLVVSLVSSGLVFIVDSYNTLTRVD